MKKKRRSNRIKVTKKDVTPVVSEWPNTDWMELMEQWGGTLPDDLSESHWKPFVERWRNLWAPEHDSLEVESFLKVYATPKTFAQRRTVGWGKRFAEIRASVIEPLSMALGHPGDLWHLAWPHLKPGDPLPTIADFNTRLAAWLRDVIWHKKTDALRHLITALETMPWLEFGMTEDQILERLQAEQPAIIGSNHSRMLAVYGAFFKHLNEQRRLPTKAELRGLSGLSGDEHKTNFSGYLKALGLSTLPQAKRTKDRFVKRTRSRLRTHRKR